MWTSQKCHPVTEDQNRDRHYDEVPRDSRLSRWHRKNLPDSPETVSWPWRWSIATTPSPITAALRPRILLKWHRGTSRRAGSQACRAHPSPGRTTRGKKKDPEWDKPVSDIQIHLRWVECSPPTPSPYRSNHGCTSSTQILTGLKGQLAFPERDWGHVSSWSLWSWADTRTQPAPTARRWGYHPRYSYMKSWAGLLRILGTTELLLGAGVLACVTRTFTRTASGITCLDIQPYGIGGTGWPGQYLGAITTVAPELLLSLWLVAWPGWPPSSSWCLACPCIIRTILLDSNWWPLTEFGINVSLVHFVHGRSHSLREWYLRGGLCYYPLFNTPMNAGFCRVEGGQTSSHGLPLCHHDCLSPWCFGLPKVVEAWGGSETQGIDLRQQGKGFHHLCSFCY